MSNDVAVYVLGFLLLVGLFTVFDTQGSGTGEAALLFVKMVLFAAELVVLLLTLVLGTILTALSFGAVGVLSLGILLFIILGWRHTENFVIFSLIFLAIVVILF